MFKTQYHPAPTNSQTSVLASVICTGFVSLLSAVTLLFAATANAATWGTDVVFDLTAGTEINDGDNGNAFNYSVDGISMQLTSWSDLGTGTTLQAAEVHSRAEGMGTCNDMEDGSFLGLIDYACGEFWNFDQADRQNDNAGERDWFLLTFSEQVLFQNIELTPIGTRDMDITFRVGNLVSFDLENVDYSELTDIGFTGSRYNRFTDPVNALIQYDITATGASNAILIGGMFEDLDDAFLASSITVQAVPVPAAVWLLASALGGLLGFRRRH